MFCQYCKKELTKPSQVKFCSRSCSVSYNNTGWNRNGLKNRRPCKICGKETRNKFYCSNNCKNADYIDQWLAGNLSTVGVPNCAKPYLISNRGHKCEICNTTEWMGQEVPLILDHINGNPEDHRLENLRLVCGNCDMQLPTYKSRNKGNGRYLRRKRYAAGKSY